MHNVHLEQAVIIMLHRRNKSDEDVQVMFIV